jgi:histidyl-tRNA synthetase
MADTQTSFILKPPKGMVDYGPLDNLKRDWVMSQIEKVMKEHNIPKLDTPVIERREILYAKTSEEGIKQIFDLADRGLEENEESEESEKLSLRFDLTVPLARYLAQHSKTKFIRYQTGKVYRGENVSLTKGSFFLYFVLFYLFKQTNEDTVSLCSLILT